MSRSKAREVAMMMSYSRLMGGGDTPADVCDKLGEPDVLDPIEAAYAEAVASGVAAHASELDALIAAYATGWSLVRIGRVDLSILRVAVYEMRFRDDVPTGAAINEAVELAKRYGGEKSSSFINGILGTLARADEAGDEAEPPTEAERTELMEDAEAAEIPRTAEPLETAPI